MSKLDLVKEYKSYYKAREKPEIVEFEKANYLAVDGKGEPAGEMYIIDMKAFKRKLEKARQLLI